MYRKDSLFTVRESTHANKGWLLSLSVTEVRTTKTTHDYRITLIEGHGKKRRIEKNSEVVFFLIDELISEVYSTETIKSSEKPIIQN